MESPEDILNARRLIFPGVGAFAPAMDVLNQTGLVFITYIYFFCIPSMFEFIKCVDAACLFKGIHLL